jgi:phosphoglycerate kinase
MKGLDTPVEKAKNMLKDYPDHIDLPTDLAVLQKEKRNEISVEELPTEEAILDIGHKTADHFADVVRRAKTVVANGPLGVFEKNGFDYGTRKILEAVSECDGYTVIGGGHLTGLASIMGIENQVSHLSTAGGAMLSLLAGEKLPVVDALERAVQRSRKAMSKRGFSNPRHVFEKEMPASQQGHDRHFNDERFALDHP